MSSDVGAVVAPTVSSSAEAVTPAPPRGPWLVLARVLFVVGLVASLTIYLAAMTRGDDVLGRSNLRAAYFDRSPLMADLWVIGVPIPWQDALNQVLIVVTYIVFPLLSYAVAGLIASRRWRDWMALLVALMLVAGAPGLTGLFWYLDDRWPLPLLVVCGILDGLLFVSTVLFVPFLFPDGRFVPRWTWLLPTVCLVVFVGIGLLGLDFAPAWMADLLPPWLVAWGWLLLPGTLLAGVVNQVYRYRWLSTPIQRQQTRWAALGIGLTLVLLAATMVTERLTWLLWGDYWRPPLDFIRLKVVIDLIGFSALLLLPVTIGLAVLRSRLWDLDPLVNRTLVWGALTAVVVTAYALLVGGLSLLFQTGGNALAALIATGLIAVAFQPARERVQRAVNRLMYGDRDEPQAVVARLGERLEASLAPESVLPTIVQTVREALKLPYVAIVVAAPRALPAEASGSAGPAAEEVVAVAGALVPEPVVVPLVAGGEPVGRLLLGRRAPGEEFSRADRRLLDQVARQAGLALQAMRLAADVQRSRQRLVTAREEERRRLRRDLHDGLGADLAALNLQVGALRPLIGREPAAAVALVPELQEFIRASIAAIRRLVYGLRPPALDELGLVGALRARGAQVAGTAAEGLTVTVEATGLETPLPAAVEVAAYWIVQEALTNVARHARAHAAMVRLSLADDTLTVEVSDDGVGLSAERPMGMGLHSMRERAEELGGTCRVEAGPGGGTRVVARLPLPPEG